MRHVVVFAALAFATIAIADPPADKEAKIKELKAKLADQKASLAKVQAAVDKTEAELDQLDADSTRPGVIVTDQKLIIGAIGSMDRFNYKVKRVIDENTVIIGYFPGAPDLRWGVKGYSTKGLVDNATVRMLGEWKVVGTGRVGIEQLYIVEPRKGAKIVPE